MPYVEAMTTGWIIPSDKLVHLQGFRPSDSTM